MLKRVIDDVVVVLINPNGGIHICLNVESGKISASDDWYCLLCSKRNLAKEAVAHVVDSTVKIEAASKMNE